MTILVVESDPAVCRVMARLLQSDGFHVVTASGARDAMSLLRRIRQPDAVALVAAEWEPPDMDGAEFLASVERIAPGIPVLRLWPAADPLAPSQVDRRADPVVAAKPFRAEGLRRHVRAALGIPPRDGTERRRSRIPA